jgi:molybdate transport system substrate-binding protein
VDLSIAGAASLRDVLAEVEAEYEAAVPAVTLTVATDSSTTLRTQIEQGAPVDVFVSADQTNPDALADAGLALDEPVIVARNALTIAVPDDNAAGIVDPADIAKDGVRIIAAGEAVPITAYASELVANLGRLPGYPGDFEARYAANVVSREENVRAVVAKLEVGEGDAAIVYRTDVTEDAEVRAIDVAHEANVSALYAGVVVAATEHPAAARAFVAWLAGPSGTAIFARFGFLAPS